jgi:hypothetical protein
MKKIYTFIGQKGKNRPPEPKIQNQYGRVIYPLIGNFIWMKKIYTFIGRKGKNRPPKSKIRLPEPKIGIWDRKFYRDKENTCFYGSKKVKIDPRARKRNM